MATISASVTPDAPPLLTLTVTDLKNWAYCPRVVYYTTFLARRPTTFKMDDGRASHEHTTELEERRSLRAYGLRDGERRYHVHLKSERLGLSGLLDMEIVTADEAIPVEFKTTSGVSQNHKVQLAAYAALVAEAEPRPVRRGYIYLIPARRAQRVDVTPELTATVTRMLAEARQCLVGEIKPPPTDVRQRCRDCEFRRYCADL